MRDACNITENEEKRNNENGQNDVCTQSATINWNSSRWILDFLYIEKICFIIAYCVIYGIDFYGVIVVFLHACTALYT